MSEPRPTAMSYDSSEMRLKGFRGVGTVLREQGENFIIVARDEKALAVFWKAWDPGFTPDESKYSKSIVVSDTAL